MYIQEESAEQYHAPPDYSGHTYAPQVASAVSEQSEVREEPMSQEGDTQEPEEQKSAPVGAFLLNLFDCVCPQRIKELYFHRSFIVDEVE